MPRVLQNLDLQAITNLLLIIFLGIFLVKVSKVFDKLIKQSREERETVSEHVEIARPEQALGTLLKDNHVTNNDDNKKKILLEIEFPDLPERITLSIDKLPELLKLLDKTGKNHRFLTNELENPEPYREEAPQLGGGTTEETEAPTSKGVGNRIGTVSLMGHRESPWIDIVSKVSGLEFSGDGKKVYCPQHGWVDYIVTTDGRILCGYDYHTLFDPNKPKTYPLSEIKKMKKELRETMNEIQELRNKAAMETPGQISKEDIEEENAEEEEGETEKEYEEE